MGCEPAESVCLDIRHIQVEHAMNYARWVFRVAGVYGLLVITPMYFMEEQIGVDSPPPINHPEYFYGFIV